MPTRRFETMLFQYRAKPEVEPAIKGSERAGFRVVNATKTVGLHHPMPDAPKENNQDDSLQVPPVERDAGHQEKERGKNEAPAEALEQGAVAVCSDHSREVMSHRAESGDEKVNVLWAPARLREREHGQNEQWRADVKNQVAPAVQDPKV